MNLSAGAVQFKPAKFDTSTSIGVQGVIEECIVTACGIGATSNNHNRFCSISDICTGSYVVSWRFRDLTMDYKKLQKEPRV